MSNSRIRARRARRARRSIAPAIYQRAVVFQRASEACWLAHEAGLAGEPLLRGWKDCLAAALLEAEAIRRETAS